MFQRFLYSLQRFMFGRNGLDRLNVYLLCGSFALNIVFSLLYRIAAIAGLLVLSALSIVVQLITSAMLIWCVFRILSRNLPARQRENQWFIQLTRKLTDRNNRYYRCPQCRQTVRVPRGRGKICIKCPKCGEKFVRKS